MAQELERDDARQGVELGVMRFVLAVSTIGAACALFAVWAMV